MLIKKKNKFPRVYIIRIWADTFSGPILVHDRPFIDVLCNALFFTRDLIKKKFNKVAKKAEILVKDEATRRLTIIHSEFMF